jgi:hypothetical protein
MHARSIIETFQFLGVIIERMTIGCIFIAEPVTDQMPITFLQVFGSLSSDRTSLVPASLEFPSRAAGC